MNGPQDSLLALSQFPKWKSLRYLAAISIAPFVLSGQPNQNDPLAELKRLTRGTKASLSPSSAHAIASELARPLTSNASTLDSVARLLAEEELEWKAGRRAGINEHKLLRALNRNLGLDAAPEYLQLREPELRRIRVALWLELPDLSGGIERKEAKKGSQVVGPVLSPFEAYVASGLLIYQKLYNDEYVRTTAEEAQQGTINQSKKPGLYSDQPNHRRTEFQQRLATAGARWSTTDGLIKAMNDLLKESRND